MGSKNKTKIGAVFMALVIVMTAICGPGSVQATPTMTTTYDTPDLYVNETAIADYYSDDSRTDDYMHETFDSCITEDIESCMDHGVGEYDGYMAGTNYVGVKSTQASGEFFGTSAIWFNASDGETYTSSAGDAYVFLDNSTKTDSVGTIEVDILIEQDTEEFELGFYFGSYIVYLNQTDADEFSTNTSISQTFTAPDTGVDLQFNLSKGTWHHVIISVVDNLIDGFELTVFVDNVSVVFSDNKLGIGNPDFKTVGITLDNGDSIGTDVLMDNLVMYNGSFNYSELYDAVAGTHLNQSIESLMGLLPLMIIGSIFMGGSAASGRRKKKKSSKKKSKKTSKRSSKKKSRKRSRRK